MSRTYKKKEAREEVRKLGKMFSGADNIEKSDAEFVEMIGYDVANRKKLYDNAKASIEFYKE